MSTNDQIEEKDVNINVNEEKKPTSNEKVVSDEQKENSLAQETEKKGDLAETSEDNQENDITEEKPLPDEEKTDSEKDKAEQSEKSPNDETTLQITEKKLDLLEDKKIDEEAQPETKAVKKVESKDSNKEEIALYEETLIRFERGQIVAGTIVSVNDKEVLVDIGYKSEGAIPISEFANTNMPELNTKINVYIEAVEDGEGKLKLSKKEADFILSLSDLKEIFEKKQTVKGILKRRVKGGMIAEIKGIDAFLPGSHISVKPIPNLDQFIGKEFDFRIISLDVERKNIIVSRKIVLEEEIQTKKVLLKDRIKIGSELDGEVKNITEYGAFVDLGGIDGLLHITDMSWGHLNHPSEMLNIGDKLKVKVIDYDEENERVSLGLKQLVPHPWENIEAKYEEGTKVTGKVVNITSYGAFVEIEPGVEGLVHVTELSWTKKINHPEQVLKVGETVDAIVLSVSREDKRISLGIKQMYPNPWLTIDDRYPQGRKFNTKIKNITPFGVFVEIEDDIDGLVHISDISWTKRIYHPREVYRKGQEIEVVVLSVDKPLHRISLGVKQLTPDPWENISENLPVNTEIEGKISKLIPKGVLVDVKSGDCIVEGFVPISHLSIPKIDNPELYFEIEEELPLKVIELDVENRRLILSVKAYFFSREKQYLIDYQKEHEEKAKKIKKEKEEKTKQQ